MENNDKNTEHKQLSKLHKFLNEKVMKTDSANFSNYLNEDVSERKYKPTQVANFLKKYGHKITPFNIRKWDELIEPLLPRDKGSVRMYSERALKLFNLISVLRTLEYSKTEIQEIITDIEAEHGNSRYLSDIAQRMHQIGQSFSDARDFLNSLHD